MWRDQFRQIAQNGMAFPDCDIVMLKHRHPRHWREGGKFRPVQTAIGATDDVMLKGHAGFSQKPQHLLNIHR